MGCSRQGYWSGLPFSSPGDLPGPGIEPSLPHCKQTLYHLRPETTTIITDTYTHTHTHTHTHVLKRIGSLLPKFLSKQKLEICLQAIILSAKEHDRRRDPQHLQVRMALDIGFKNVNSWAASQTYYMQMKGKFSSGPCALKFKANQPNAAILLEMAISNKPLPLTQEGVRA